MAKFPSFLCVFGLLLIFSSEADSFLSNVFKEATSILHKGEKTLGNCLSNITNSASNNGTEENCYDELGCFSMKAPWTSILRPLPPPMPPTKLNTRLYCFVRDSTKQYNVTFWPTISLGGFPFGNNRTTVFISHGFINNANATWCTEMKDAYLAVVDANICLVDWGEGATMLNYLQVASNTRIVGAELARFITYLQQNYGLIPGNIHFIGHSLGAHISAYAAKNITGVKRITALDPAQPGFEFCDKAVRLDKDDALFVDAIHTNAAPLIPTLGFGMMNPTAHVDFYVNGGLRQPGCTLPSITNVKSILDLAYYPVEKEQLPVEWEQTLLNRVRGKVPTSGRELCHCSTDSPLHAPSWLARTVDACSAVFTAHVDFYQNSGLTLPGCTLPSITNVKSILDLAYYPVKMVTMWVICSHSRAIDYFISSLNTNCSIWGRTCSLKKHILKGTLLGFIDPTFSNVETCTADTCIRMGLETPLYKARGIFSVATPSTAPYCDTKEENSQILSDIMNTAAKVTAVSSGVNKTVDIAADVIDSFDHFKEDVESKANIGYNKTGGSFTGKLLNFKETLLKIG